MHLINYEAYFAATGAISSQLYRYVRGDILLSLVNEGFHF